MKKAFLKYGGMMLTGILIGIGVPAPVATTAGPAIHEAVGGMMEEEAKSPKDLNETE